MTDGTPLAALAATAKIPEQRLSELARALGIDVQLDMSAIEAARLVFAILSGASSEDANLAVSELGALGYAEMLARSPEDEWEPVGPEFLDAEFHLWLGGDLLFALSSLIEQMRLGHDAMVGLRLERVVLALTSGNNNPVVWIAVRAVRGASRFDFRLIYAGEAISSAHAAALRPCAEVPGEAILKLSELVPVPENRYAIPPELMVH